ncbi:MAG: hypothetical protein LIP77_08365 [Planctomycetes bacterium]|nr:hypothetical protein [Planctomycetota bacterium]
MGLGLVILYGAVLAGVARRSRRAEADSAWFVAGRNGSAAGVAASLIVSCVGASATMGMAGLAFTTGLPALWWLGSGALGLAVLARVLAARVRDSGCYTLPELIQRLLGDRPRRLAAAIIVAAWTAISAAQFSALTTLLTALTGVTRPTAAVLGLVLVVGHSRGGQAAILRTDRLQFLVLAGGMVLLLVGLQAANPGWLGSVRPELLNDRFRPGDLLRCLLAVGGNYVVCPMLFGRLFSARDAGAARRGAGLAAMGLALAATAVVAAGLACRGLVPADTRPDAVLTAAVGAALPPWLGAGLLLMLIAAVVSSGDSCLVTAATVLGHDLLGSSRAATGRRCVLVLGAAGFLLAQAETNLVALLFMAYDIYAAGVVLPVFIALIAGRERLRRPGWALVGMAVGGGCGLAAVVTGWPPLASVGMGLSALATLSGLRRAPTARSSTGTGSHDCHRR